MAAAQKIESTGSRDSQVVRNSNEPFGFQHLSPQIARTEYLSGRTGEV
jgi:hypothetical protein